MDSTAGGGGGLKKMVRRGSLWMGSEGCVWEFGLQKGFVVAVAREQRWFGAVEGI